MSDVSDVKLKGEADPYTEAVACTGNIERKKKSKERKKVKKERKKEKKERKEKWELIKISMT